MNDTTLTFFSLNVRGLNTDKKRTILFDWLSDVKYDVMILQETHFVGNQECIYNSQWFGEIINCYSETIYSTGVSILLKKNSKIEITNYHRSVNERRLLVILDILKGSLVNIYAPNNEKDRVEFFKRLTAWINKNSINLDNVILCGDFYCQIKNELCDKTVNILKKISKTFGVKDSWTYFEK